MCLRNKIAAIFSCLLVIACRKAEIPVQPFNRGDVITAAVDMNIDYRYQIFYSVSENKIVSTNLKTAWDLGFEGSGEGFHVVLNTSRAMRVYNTGKTDFASVTDTLGLGINKQTDSPTGNLDSTGFGNWQLTRPVYIVDLGYNEFNTQHLGANDMNLGYKKMQLLAVNASAYSIKIANVNGTSETVLSIPKNPNKNFVDFSFVSNSVVNVEPDKTTYDLLFTQYTALLNDGGKIVPYQVTGALFNPYKIRGVRVFNKPFADISANDTSAYQLKPVKNVIGHDWKDYDFSSGVYATDTKKNFLFQSVEGFYYKLHFIDFHNQQGAKGAPKFEFKKL